MKKILGVSLVVILALGVGSYALGHGSPASVQNMAGPGGTIGQGMMNGRGMMMGQGGMMGGSGIIDTCLTMMNGFRNFMEMCRSVMAGWFGPGSGSSTEDPYRHGERAPYGRSNL